MNTDAETTRPRRRWGKVVTRIVLPTIAVSLVVTAVITVRRYTAPERIRAAAEAYLRQYTSGQVSVG